MAAQFSYFTTSDDLREIDGYYVSPGVFLLSNTRLITISAAENTAVDFCLPEKNR